MNTIELRTIIQGVTNTYPLTIAPEQVMQGKEWYAGLRLSAASYDDIDAQGVNAELPLYCFHEGCDMGGSFEDCETEAVVGTWQIMLNGAPADYEAVQAVIDAA